MSRNLSGTRVDLLSSVKQAADVAGRHAAEGDEARRLAPSVVEALLAAGFSRLFVPTRWGGRAGSFTELLHAVAAVGEACTSAAWSAGLAAGSSRMAAFLPLEGQSELWAANPDVPIACALNPAGSATPVPGGWLLTGEWPYASGSDFSEWALLYTEVVDEGAERGLFFAVPRSAYQVRDTWNTVGMRATASNTVVVENIFVPRHRTLDKDSLLRGDSVGSTARCHTVPHVAVTGLLFAAPALGAARGMLRTWTAIMSTKTGPGGRAARDRSAVQLALTRAEGEIDAASMFLERTARVCDSAEIDSWQQARNGADCALAVDYLSSAVDRLFSTSGTAGQQRATALERAWRDVRAIASHAAMQIDMMAARYATQVLRPAA
ncbi:acyl-CoA dehydrogenase family protein [Saccharomonospora saliphila]|uniref:acyl-CoA dehydrogenase family protein n=1 Tax=Saccharomonospora saliphila TaxID=369829 RepID=UPI00036E515E|nr:acyl-CoA dehydrogenase family protein [Saccharomonospora saliphila]